MKTNTPLFNGILKYIKKNRVSFHMPGHKGGLGLGDDFKACMPLLDVTETPGMDNLHRPKGSILKLQQRAAEVFGGDRSFLLVNGSTGGVHAMVLAACRPGDKIIISRDCHRSVVAGVILAGLRPVYITPSFIKEYAIMGSCTPDQVKYALTRHPDAKAVLLTYPNYYGLCGYLKDIADIVHHHGALLLVDGAHGAHLGLSPDLPQDISSCGADMWVSSIHKTLSGLNQTALLHVKGNRVDVDRLSAMVSLVQTTSPSYVLMSSIDLAVDKIAGEGRGMMEVLLEKVKFLRRELEAVEGVAVLDQDAAGGFGVCALDPTKVTIKTGNIMTGYEMEGRLWNKYGISIELSAPNHILLLTTIFDDFDMYGYTIDAFQRIVKEFGTKAGGDMHCPVPPPMGPAVMYPREAFLDSTVAVPIEQGTGCISAALVSVYPPGIPLLCPGEMVTRDAVEYIEYIKGIGGSIIGLWGPSEGELLVVDEG
ncbi:MAG: aminotransferase class I/II-fold pyridoxal phosphate-dependent enzyme [Mahellales bacterium]